ncbi:hypothetical protein [Kribbella sp. CA-294648]|uniref:hypothetical protein n=1 Tax=Kribbella sp. CA-294648 TaxID=3239948 RepID=UPI003D938A1D
MTVRRRFTVMLAAVGLAAGLLSTATPATAGTAAVPTDTCGGSVYVSPDREVRTLGSNIPVAKIQLRRDSNYYYWSCITFYSAVPTGYWATARLTRYLDGSFTDEFACGRGGGTPHVSAGMRFCRSPKILAPSSRVTFYAEGFEYKGSTEVVAWGDTIEGR